MNLISILAKSNILCSTGRQIAINVCSCVFICASCIIISPANITILFLSFFAAPPADPQLQAGVQPRAPELCGDLHVCARRTVKIQNDPETKLIRRRNGHEYKSNINDQEYNIKITSICKYKELVPGRHSPIASPRRKYFIMYSLCTAEELNDRLYYSPSEI